MLQPKNRRHLSFVLFAALFLSLAARAQAVEPSLRWLGHAAFEFTSRSGKIYLIDPWITNPKAPKGISYKRVDGILITHAHSDHVGEAFDLAKKFNATIIASYELTGIAQKKGVKNVLPINPSGSQRVEDITITAVQAIHSSGFADGDQTVYGGAPIGFIIAEDGAPAFYHAGDTGVFSDMAMIGELYQPQIALLPIGGVFTMKPKEAALAARNLHVRVVVPMHFGTFPALTGTPEQLANEMKRIGLPTAVRELKIGETIALKDLNKS